MEDSSPREVLVDINLEGRILSGKEITLIGDEVEFTVSLMRVPHIMQTEGSFQIDGFKYCLQGKEFDPDKPMQCIITGTEGLLYGGKPPQTIMVHNSLYDLCEKKDAQPAEPSPEPMPEPEPVPEPTPEPATAPEPVPLPEPTPQPPPEPMPEPSQEQEQPEPETEEQSQPEVGVQEQMSAFFTPESEPTPEPEPAPEPPPEPTPEEEQPEPETEEQPQPQEEASTQESDDFEPRLKELEEAVKTHETSLEEKESEITRYKENLEEAGEKISSLENELSGIKKETGENNEKARAELENLTAQRDELNRKIETMDKEMEELADNNIELEQQAGPLLENVKTLTAEKEEAENKYLELEEKSKREIEKDDERVKKTTRELHEAIKKLTKFDLMATELLDAGQDVPFEEKLEIIKQYMVDRSNLKQIFTSLKEEGKISVDEMPEAALPDDYRDLKKAATYVMINIFHNAEGNIDSAEETIGKVLNSFQSIDPSEVGLPEKDIKILGEYLVRELENSEQAGSADYGALISSIIEHQTRPLLSELPDPSDRTSKLEEMKPDYEKYEPKEI